MSPEINTFETRPQETIYNLYDFTNKIFSMSSKQNTRRFNRQYDYFSG